MPLFEVAILKKPTPKEEENGAVEELVWGPVAVVAKDSQSAGLAAIWNEKRPEGLDLSRAAVLVRPFA